ncbi:MAG: stage III sporulation protein AD [Clostridia bacterium]|nr:stage III sporulation protein AD [Clostridia bacterium]
MGIVKIIGIAFCAVTIIIIIKQYKPEFAIYISLIASILILFLVLDKLSGIVGLITSLSNKISGNGEFLKILIKITGIAFLTEFAVSICKDAGENAIGTKVDVGGKVIIAYMSIPIIGSMLETILQILP